MCRICKSFLVTEVERKHVRRRASLVAVACFLPGRAKGLLALLSKGIPRAAEVALGVPGRLRPRIFLTFGTTRVVGRQPKVPSAFTPGKIPGTHFQRLSRPQGTWFRRKELRKKSQVTPPGIDPGTVLLVAQRLNPYANPGYQHPCICICVCVCMCVCVYIYIYIHIYVMQVKCL